MCSHVNEWVLCGSEASPSGRLGGPAPLTYVPPSGDRGPDVLQHRLRSIHRFYEIQFLVFKIIQSHILLVQKDGLYIKLSKDIIALAGKI